MCNSCASLAGLVLSFIPCFILLVIAPLARSPASFAVSRDYFKLCLTLLIHLFFVCLSWFRCRYTSPIRWVHLLAAASTCPYRLSLAWAETVMDTLTENVILQKCYKNTGNYKLMKTANITAQKVMIKRCAT